MEQALLNQVLMIFGAVTVLLLLFVGLLALFVITVVFVSIKHGKFYFPKLLRSAFTYMESATRHICRMMGLKDSDITIFFIHLHNEMSAEDFSKIPAEETAIFLPHCLRSSKCPAELSTEGLGCKHCGGCSLDRSINELEAMGYKVFIVPGSTFIGRMVKKYMPHAIIGVGCLMEIKEGLEFADRIGLVAMGVVNKTDGCIETLTDWPELMMVASRKAPKE